MQSKFVLLGGVFLEVLCLLGGVAFFAGQHKAHLDQLQDKLNIIEKSTTASEAALGSLLLKEKEIADARREIDRKLLEAPDGAMCYEYYDRLLREDACRRAGSAEASGAVDDAMP